MSDAFRKLSKQVAGPIRRYSTAVGVSPRRWSSVPIWICGALIMMGLTINDLYPVIADFFDDDANVNAKITVTRQEPSKNPQLFLCLPIPSLSASSHFGKLKRKLISGGNCTECTELENRSWDIWSRMDRNSTTFLLDLFHGFLEKILQDNLTEIIRSGSVLDNSRNDWRKPLIDIAWITITRISKLDAAFRNGTLRRGRWYTIGNHFSGNRSASGYLTDRRNRSASDNQGDPVSDLQSQSQSTNQIDPLFNGLIEFVCNFIEIYSTNASDPTGNCSDIDCLRQCIDILSISAAIKGSENTFCFEFPSAQRQFQLSIKEEFFDYLVARKPFSIYFENPVFSENAELIYRSPIQEGGQVSMRKAETVKLRYSIVNKVIEERDGKNPFQDRSQIDCLAKCKIDLIEKLCQCHPFIARKFGIPNVDRYCLSDHYENCSGKIDISSCNDRCATAQEHTTYQWIIDRQAINSVKPSFTLDVGSLMRPYMECSMSYRDSKAKLVSQIGGVFNFYLGWSGLSIIVFSIYCLNAYMFYRRQKNEDLQTRETWMKVLWQWRWAQLAGQVAQQELQTNRYTYHDRNGEIVEMKAIIEQLSNEMRVEMRMLRNELVMNGNHNHEKREMDPEVDCTRV